MKSILKTSLPVMVCILLHPFISLAQFASVEESFSSSRIGQSTHLTFQVEDDNAQNFNSIRLNDSGDLVALDAKQVISFISIYKGNEIILARMPIDSKNLNLSMDGYEKGIYEIHCFRADAFVPSIVSIEKH